MEIGFNASYSSEIFLKYTDKNSKVTSFDINQYDYVKLVKRIYR